MQQSGAIARMEDLEAWFNNCGDKMTYWTLYRGQDTKGGIILRNEHTETKDESIKMLKSTLTGQSVYGGTFFCFVPTTKGGSNGFSTVIVLPPQAQTATMGGAASINGIPNGGLPLGIGSLDDYERRLKKEWELEQKIKDLERKSDVNPYIGALMEHPTFDAKLATHGVMGLANSLVEIGRKMAGLPPSVPMQRPPINGLPKSEKSDTEDDVLEVNGALLNQGVTELADIFPNEKPEVLILAICSYLRNNAGMLGMLNGQLEPYLVQIKQEIEQ